MSIIRCAVRRQYVDTSRSLYDPSPKFGLYLVAGDGKKTDFDRVNAAMQSDGTAREKIRERIERVWGTRRYRKGSELLEDDGLVGILKETGNFGMEELLNSISALINNEGIYEYTVEMKNHGYNAVFSGRERTSLNVVYDNRTKMFVIHRYKNRLRAAGARRVAALVETQPRRVDHYNYNWGEGTTLYLGVKFSTDGDKITPTLLTERRKGLDYWILKGDKVTYISPQQAENDVEERITRAIREQNPIQKSQSLSNAKKYNYSVVFLAWHTNGRYVGFYKGPFYEAFLKGIQKAQSAAIIDEIRRIHTFYNEIQSSIPGIETAAK